MRKLSALAALLALSSPALADPGDDAARYAERIDKLDDGGPEINAVIVYDRDAAVAAARQASGPLAGRTVLVKDNIETREWPTTAGSLALKDNMTGRDAPLPEDEPHELRSVACGLRVSPPTALHPLVELPLRMLAHSDRLVLPSTTPPASRSRATNGASRPVSFVASARLPAVVGHSRVSMLSFTRTARPSSERSVLAIATCIAAIS